MKNPENELKILELISQGKDDISQRDISRIIGLSLGMTNSILKRFAEKGLITIKKVNNRNIQYALTAKGLEQIGQKSWRYFKRTIRNVVVYREAINGILREAKADGYNEVVLVGSSDLEFIVEHECYKLGIPFRVAYEKTEEISEKSYIVFAENELKQPVENSYSYSLNSLVY
ncbi:winged helix-turn-helix transcriptional regulator [Spirochaeta isovalerica]|uniref:DNA-binding MarR family transcriptional regulator n=1 Tax=Spirochaeta isovalerica TaxID=150 RepID=A0A841RCP2_9SPIO|nr:winged helix-turn-helix transcriptional regulator [Spirochaeta isovalerica]MBB6480760.1 DNA-binding MarR family transcriptional regulator [Spirochaeta isovalerica]